MAGGLYSIYGNKREFPRMIAETAERIKKACLVSDWQTATEDQLKLRDRIHENAFLLCDIMKDPEQVVKIAIKKGLDSQGALKK
jgi:hypothetical protein